MSASDYSISISGGANSSEANYNDMEWVASRAHQLAEDLHTIALQVSALSYDDDLDASAEFAPDTYAAVQAAFDRAVHEPGGLFAVESKADRRAEDLTTAIRNYQDSDFVMADLMSGVWTWFQGASQFNLLRLAYIYDMYDLHGEQWLVEHPGLLQDTIAAAPNGAVMPFSVTDAAGALALLWGDGEGSAGQIGENDLLDTEDALAPPTGLGNIFGALSSRADASSGSRDEIDVRRVEHDGTVSYIVDIPGTRDWNWRPDAIGTPNPNTNDLTTNLEAMSGVETARQQAIADALRQAGATADDPVMLVGHSQGGIVAAQAAADSADGTFGYNVTHVITAGSPISNADIPPGVQVLSLENSGDIVPTLDGADNPDTANITTVTFDNQTDTIGGNHGLGDDLDDGTEQNYTAVAQVLDSSDDPAIQAYIDSASAFIYTDPTGVDMQVTGYEITRD